MHRSCLVLGAALFVAACGSRTASTGGGDGDSGDSTESSGDAGTAEESGSESETGEESGETCGDGVVDPGEDCEPGDGDPLCNDDCSQRGSLQYELEFGQYSPVRVGAGGTSAYLAGVTDDGITVAAVSLEDGSVQWQVEGIEGTTSSDRPLDVLVTPDDELLVLTTTEAAQLGPDERSTVIHYGSDGGELGRADPADGRWLRALAWAAGVVGVGDDGLVVRVGIDGPVEIQELSTLGEGRDLTDVARIGEDLFVAVSGNEFIFYDAVGEVVSEVQKPEPGVYVSINESDASVVMTVGVLGGVVPESTFAENQPDGLVVWGDTLDRGLDGEIFRSNDERTIVGRTYADFSGDGLIIERRALDDSMIWSVSDPDGFVYQDAALGPEGQVVVGSASGLRIYRP